MKIELNEEFKKALSLMEDEDRPVIITGRAGTGKSTLLEYFRKNTKKRVVVLAPTGVAAVNVKGQTIHSFFSFRPDITPENAKEIIPKNRSLYKGLDAIIIDEISMVRADLLDCIDQVLRRYGPNKGKPFGGIQMIFIGDLYQLPPVVTTKEKDLIRSLYRSPYFFDSKVFQEIEPEFVELEKVYRQKDQEFLEILNAIRNKTISKEQLVALNSRYIPGFEPKEGLYIHLTTTNRLAEEINRKKLKELKGKRFVYKGSFEGQFDESAFPAPYKLELKIGAQVMLLNNDPAGRWVNGSMGYIADIEVTKDRSDIIWVELDNSDVVDVTVFKWEMYEYSYDQQNRTLFTDIVGTYTQYPIRLAWAITIHKSQGLTFDRALIDIGRGTFSHGQLYVALSRCRTLEGMVLNQPIERKHIWLDDRVVRFLTDIQYRRSEKETPLEEKIALIERAIREGRTLEMVYLKARDEKSKRTILPLELAEMSYKGRNFTGLRAMCNMRKEERIFNVKRIISLRMV